MALSAELIELDKLAMQRAAKAHNRLFAKRANSEQQLLALIEKAEKVVASFCALPSVTRHHEKMMEHSCDVLELRSQIALARNRRK